MANRFTLTAFFVVSLAVGTVANAHAGAILADIENALMCECDDKCGKVLINCNCSTSDKHRADLKRHIESGLTKEQIIKIYVDKYGEKVLSAPTKTGFNITAWITPFAALLGGGIGIRQLIRVWIRKSSDDSDGLETGTNAIPDPDFDNKYSKRLQSELDKIDN